MICPQNRLYHDIMKAANFELNREITDKFFFFKLKIGPF